MLDCLIDFFDAIRPALPFAADQSPRYQGSVATIMCRELRVPVLRRQITKTSKSSDLFNRTYFLDIQYNIDRPYLPRKPKIRTKGDSSLCKTYDPRFYPLTSKFRLIAQDDSTLPLTESDIHDTCLVQSWQMQVTHLHLRKLLQCPSLQRPPSLIEPS